jgi:hypothetical protein
MRLGAGEQLVQQHAGRVHVGAGVGDAARDLLRRQVRGRSDDHPGSGVADPRSGPGQPEVSDLDRIAVAEQDVLRLDVPVHDPRLVGGSQAAEHPADDVERLARAEPAALAQQFPQRPAGDVLHDQVQQASVGTLVVDGDHVRAGQPRHRPRLAGKAPDEFRIVGQLRVSDLERHRTIQLGVGAQVDRGHAAAGDPGAHPVPTVEQLARVEAGKGGIHREKCKGRYPCAGSYRHLRGHMIADGNMKIAVRRHRSPAHAERSRCEVNG